MLFDACLEEVDAVELEAEMVEFEAAKLEFVGIKGEDGTVALDTGSLVIEDGLARGKFVDKIEAELELGADYIEADAFEFDCREGCSAGSKLRLSLPWKLRESAPPPFKACRPLPRFKLKPAASWQMSKIKRH